MYTFSFVLAFYPESLTQAYSEKYNKTCTVLEGVEGLFEKKPAKQHGEKGDKVYVHGRLSGIHCREGIIVRAVCNNGDSQAQVEDRSEERRVGKECSEPC